MYETTDGAAVSAGKCRFISVTIDVKPGSFPNSVNPRSHGRIPVAIISSPTSDAAGVDPSSVRLGPNGTEAAPLHSAFEDVDGDGDLDMIVHFSTSSVGIPCGAISVKLSGKTFAGQPFEGVDSVRTVGCK